MIQLISVAGHILLTCQTHLRLHQHLVTKEEKFHYRFVYDRSHLSNQLSEHICLNWLLLTWVDLDALANMLTDWQLHETPKLHIEIALTLWGKRSLQHWMSGTRNREPQQKIVLIQQQTHHRGQVAISLQIQYMGLTLAVMPYWGQVSSQNDLVTVEGYAWGKVVLNELRVRK